MSSESSYSPFASSRCRRRRGRRRAPRRQTGGRTGDGDGGAGSETGSWEPCDSSINKRRAGRRGGPQRAPCPEILARGSGAVEWGGKAAAARRAGLRYGLTDLEPQIAQISQIFFGCRLSASICVICGSPALGLVVLRAFASSREQHRAPCPLRVQVLQAVLLVDGLEAEAGVGDQLGIGAEQLLGFLDA